MSQLLLMMPSSSGLARVCVVTLNVTVKTSTVKMSVPNVQLPNICGGKQQMQIMKYWINQTDGRGPRGRHSGDECQTPDG